MTNQVVIDSRMWSLHECLGTGGFGEVYAARSGGEERVIKLVPIGPGSVRELFLAKDLRSLPNVVPILGETETATHWALLMPRAEKSLRQQLDEYSGPFDQAAAMPILVDLASALDALSRTTTPDGKTGVIHRDLKPENVLLLDGRWCLSDFGISRYAHASTEADTRRYHMTWQYAAPEQWRGETATSQTDVYALGVIAYEMLAGVRPFLGPGHSEFREQHLHQAPPDTPGVPPKLATLISECLYKDAGTRPSPARLHARLADLATSRAAATRGRTALHEAELAETIRRGGEAAAGSNKQAEGERRAHLVATANREIERISAELKDAILTGSALVRDVTEEGPLWAQTRDEREWMLSLNLAELIFQDSPRADGWAPPRGRHPLDVITYATLVLATAARERRPRGRIDSLYVGRSHSLWYCDAEQEGQYAWYEFAFVSVPGTEDKDGLVYYDPVPFALHPADDNITQAFPVGGDDYSLYRSAWPITRIMDDLDGFIDRWITWFADASRGKALPAATPVPRRPGDRALAAKLQPLSGDAIRAKYVYLKLSRTAHEAALKDQGYLDESGLVRPRTSWPVPLDYGPSVVTPAWTEPAYSGLEDEDSYIKSVYRLDDLPDVYGTSTDAAADPE